MKNVIFKNFLLASVIALVFACESDDKTARVEFWLTDAPGDYQEVNVEVEGIEIHTDQTDNGKGWQQIDVKTRMVNLLDLTNGKDTLLASIDLPAGKISQIRLKLGNNNSLKVNDQLYSLTVPSGAQSGLKLQVHETFVEGITYKILLDFDVARSIVLTGSNQYKLKPVILSITEAESGAIKGMVDPKEATPAIYAIDGEDTLRTTYSDPNGQFLLKGIPAGTYEVHFVPNSNYKTIIKEGVNVQVGVVTDLETVAVPEN